ncbi:hypothetical protein AB5J62_19605 [Amycolatopsis sp. cg5]|uniref:hypothetical protein n=1 Tax=Amycolatopsis sp. cg5 TaxID=3238802 RepID=UPI00352372A5
MRRDVPTAGASAGGVETLRALMEIAPETHHYRCRVGHAWSAAALLIERNRRSADESSIAAEVLRKYLIALNPPLEDGELIP